MKRLLICLSFLFHLTFCIAQQSAPVILVAGQSNADGRVSISELPANIHYNHCRWSYGSGDFLKADGQFKPFSPTVARTALGDCWGFDAVVYYLLEQQLQCPFYVIKQTMGGTAIDTACTKSTRGWYWSVDAKKKSLLKAFEQQIDDCLPNLPKNYDIKCLIWHQGESDQPAADRYHDNLKAVIAHLRQHLEEVTGNARYASLPIVCGTFAKGSRQGSKKVVEALYRLQSEDVNFHVVDASDLSLQNDQLHFDAQGAIILGHRVFEKLMKRPLDVWPVTDKSFIKSLNGEWLLKVIDKIDDHPTPVPAADASWGKISVPGCWESYGFCKPKYNYPDSLTGYYRTSFTIPKTWKGQQIIIRLDGVLRGYDLWLNDQYVGTWESGYNTCLFDLTPYLTKKAFKGEPQQLAMRVYSQFKGYEFDCFDDWATMGIFRDVTLFPVPETHLSDLTVTTKMNGEVTVKTIVANATKHTSISCEILDADGRVAGEAVANCSLFTLHFSLTDCQGHTFLHQSFVLNKPEIAWTGHGSGAVMAQDTTIRTGHKPTMTERITQKGRQPQHYLLPIDNNQVKADIQSHPIEGGEEITFALTPDTADVFRSELGLAYLLKPEIDRVQWWGLGPFASYPGRYRANRYGFWAKHKDDLYFEGNHGGIDAAFFSDKQGNGVLVVGDSLNLNFEQTDRGIVMTVNASVSGLGPKFAKTAFKGWQPGDAPVSATFRFYYIKGDVMPAVVKRYFAPAADVPAPFRPFLTQYDTYLLRYDNIEK